MTDERDHDEDVVVPASPEPAPDVPFDPDAGDVDEGDWSDEPAGGPVWPAPGVWAPPNVFPPNDAAEMGEMAEMGGIDEDDSDDFGNVIVRERSSLPDQLDEG